MMEHFSPRLGTPTIAEDSPPWQARFLCWWETREKLSFCQSLRMPLHGCCSLLLVSTGTSAGDIGGRPPIINGGLGSVLPL